MAEHDLKSARAGVAAPLAVHVRLFLLTVSLLPVPTSAIAQRKSLASGSERSAYYTLASLVNRGVFLLLASSVRRLDSRRFAILDVHIRVGFVGVVWRIACAGAAFVNSTVSLLLVATLLISWVLP